jgi:hypothetical protein
MNIGAIFGEIADVYGTFEMDSAEVAAGMNVLIPIEPQIATENGEPVYLIAYLSTSKATNAPPLQTASATKPLAAVK